MPLIESSYEQPAVLASSISVRGSLVPAILNFVRLAATIRVRGTLENTATKNASATTTISVNGNLDLQVNDEASVFPQFSTNISITGNLNYVRRRRVNLSSNIRISGSLDGASVAPDRADCFFRVQIVPAQTRNSYQKYRTRLTANGENVRILSFRVNFPNNAVGSTLEVQLADPAQNQFAPTALFKFEIHDGATWNVLLDTGLLERESFVTQTSADTLEIDISSALSDRLNLTPRRTNIVYDPAKTSVDVQDLEVERDSDGNAYPVSATSFNNLSLYEGLRRAYVLGCGFDDFQTNLPDYKIARVDFGFENSYHEAIAGYVGMFDPVYFERDNILYLLDTTNALPSGLIPRVLTANRFVSLSSDAVKRTFADGYLVSFQSGGGDYFTTRIATRSEETGTFGSPNFTRTDIETTFREYRTFANPFVIVRSEIQAETRSTYNYSLNLIGRTRELRTFNNQSRLSQIRKTIDSLVPDLNNGGVRTLLQTRDETVALAYIPDPRNTRSVLNNKITTQINGLIAIDSENQYFAEDFRQDLTEADKAGNLTADMTSDYGAIKTIVETITFDNQGQSSIKIDTFDHIRNSLSGTISDAKAGANSFNQYNANRRIRVWRDGIDLTQSKGARLDPLNAGELPTVQAVALAKRKLARQSVKNQNVNFDVIGFDPSIRRGSTFNVKTKRGASFGNFLITGFNIEGVNLGTIPVIKTNLNAVEV